MKVYAIPEPIRQSVAVYVELHREPNGAGIFDVPDGVAVKVGPGEEAPLYMRIPLRIAEAVGEALAPRPVATERHLDDAIALRDRLLSLVEKAHDGPRP